MAPSIMTCAMILGIHCPALLMEPIFEVSVRGNIMYFGSWIKKWMDKGEIKIINRLKNDSNTVSFRPKIDFLSSSSVLESS